jgi:hypothetical protein
MFGADRQAALLAEPGNVGYARVGLLTTGEVCRVGDHQRL